MYSGGLFCGGSSGVNRGATGQMVELDCGANGAFECWESVELAGGRSAEFEPGDGEAPARGGDCEIDRGAYIPCSVRNWARISKARRRAASVCWAVGGSGRGEAGLEGLGA